MKYHNTTKGKSKTIQRNTYQKRIDSSTKPKPNTKEMTGLKRTKHSEMTKISLSAQKYHTRARLIRRTSRSDINELKNKQQPNTDLDSAEQEYSPHQTGSDSPRQIKKTTSVDRALDGGESQSTRAARFGSFGLKLE